MATYGLGHHGLTTSAALLGAALTWGDATALIDQDGPVTYRQLGAGAGAMAAQFARTVSPGDHVAVLVEDDRRHLMAMVALELCGARIWLVNPRLGSDDSTALVAANDIGLVVSAADLPPVHPVNRSEVPRHAKASRLVMMTGGTTAAPASVPVAPGLASPLTALALAGVTRVRHGQPVLICAPLFHGYGYSCAVLALIAGAPMVLSSACRTPGLAAMSKGATAPRPDWGQAIYETCRREGVRAILAVPAQLRSLAAYLDWSEMAGAPPLDVQAVASGGDQLDQATLTSLQTHLGPVVTNYYGTTESGTATMITGAELAARPTSLGRPVAGSRVRILDDAGQVVPRGVKGRIEPVSGLVRRGARTSHVTNDIGWVDASGYLYLEGRAGPQQRSGGEFVNLRAVERVVADMRGVVSAEAYMAPDERFGQRVAVRVQASSAVDADDIRAGLRARLGPAAVPGVVEITRLES